MLIVALILVFCSAALHVAWNVKLQSENDPLDTATKALSLGVGCLLPVILAYWLIVGRPMISLHALLFAGLSGLAELGYFWFLSYSYQRGELSVVYPMARGSAPVLSFMFGIVFLGEHISRLQVIGVICLLLGIWLVRSAAISGARGAIPALVTGVFIAAYTVLDKVGLVGIDPVLFGALKYIFTVLCLLLFAPLRPLFGMTRPLATGFQSWKKQLLIGVSIIATYQLVLFALAMAPVAIISPMRESASVVVTIWGIWKLRERNGLVPKLLGVGTIFAGIVLLAV
ncbi:MAG TPA: DMT family transporter [Candidatus Saccharimonadales bacterium]|nr:DMT family transporter [Candidatus Saccharimonadales bacterium]